ncbi:uncharacterized protein JCM6883_005577 [Sporobolomyces salmoneus]|uniref:uncharacterized protein n=1 Tax=Sporobolomyces salmoneus TaxID=183962 RepID=UPI00317D4118
MSQGYELNINGAEKELRVPAEVGHLSLLKGATALSDMEDWRQGCGRTISEIMEELTGMEERIRAAGLVAKSNVSELVEKFQFQVLEFFNRAVGDLYFNGRKDSLRYAQSLAEKHGLDINRLELNLEDDFDREDLAWFEVELDEVGGMGPGLVYGLRVRIERL